MAIGLECGTQGCCGGKLRTQTVLQGLSAISEML